MVHNRCPSCNHRKDLEHPEMGQLEQDCKEFQRTDTFVVPPVVGNVRFNSTEPPRTPTGRTKIFQFQIPDKQAFCTVSSHLAYDNSIQDPLDKHVELCNQPESAR